MLTGVQIAAILYLLVAFGADQTIVNNVATTLTRTEPTVQQVSLPVQQQNEIQPVYVQATQIAIPTISFVGTPTFEVRAWRDLGASQTIMKVIVHATTTLPSTMELTIGDSSLQAYSNKESTEHDFASGEIAGGTYNYTLRATANGQTITINKRLSQCPPSDGDHLPVKPGYDSCVQ